MNALRMMKRSLTFTVAMILTLANLLSAVGSATAQGNNLAADGKSIRTQPGPTDPAELQAFLDSLFTTQMKEHHIAGAAVAVVKDGKLFFAKGYGYADVQKGVPVDPGQTIFRIGSVGKLLTWTAVMQLAEQGKLDLNADINTYLDFRIPDTYPQPITLKHLMTHTSGFEDRLRGSVVSDAAQLVPAREWLVTHMSARVSPPGDHASYSNYNAMLAGYIVSRVSGESYERYIQEHIFDPLGMLHSTAQSPLPANLRPYASVGYTYGDGAFQPFPDYTAQQAALPSGAQQATVTDMARFMIAHLQNGRYSDASVADARILKEATAQQMRATLYSPDPRVLGTAYGFFDFSDNGQFTLGYSGYLPPMHSVLLLLPDQHLGVYVVYNSEGGGDLTNQHLGFQRAFFDHYYPAPEVAVIQSPEDFAARAGRFVGSYRMTSGSYTTIDKVGQIFGVVEISDLGDGTLLLSLAGYQWRFVEVSPLYFREVDGPFTMVFREDDQGRITYMSSGLTPMFAFEKLNWYETPGFNLALALGCLLLFLSMIPVAAIRAIRNRRRGSDPATPGAREADQVTVAICILNLLFVAGTVLWGNQPNVLSATPLIYKVVLGLGVLAAVLTAGALVYTVLAWKNRYWGAAARMHYTLVTVAAVAFVWSLNTWNLLGWRL